ncbi:MAG TPA: hypothetical protein VED41_13075, partial [Solirubrobacteraceae bacterium]|nr:hypothetical protein [Solirubrobacteraceae bacterium]
LLAATEAGIDELHHQSIKDIQRQTAVTWAGRAAAAYHFYGQGAGLPWLLDATEYEHEALEHASLVTDDPELLETVRHYLTVAKADALAGG